MELKAYIGTLTPEQRDSFALACKTTLGHMRNVMYGQKSCATDLAVHIERESKSAVTRRELRREDWHKHWPELVTAEHPAPAESPAQQTERV